MRINKILISLIALFLSFNLHAQFASSNSAFLQKNSTWLTYCEYTPTDTNTLLVVINKGKFGDYKIDTLLSQNGILISYSPTGDVRSCDSDTSDHSEIDTELTETYCTFDGVDTIKLQVLVDENGNEKGRITLNEVTGQIEPYTLNTSLFECMNDTLQGIQRVSITALDSLILGCGDCNNGFDISAVPRTCTKVNFDNNNAAFLTICNDNWTCQDLVDILNSDNPLGSTFDCNGENVTVVSGNSPSSIWFVSLNPQIEVLPNTSCLEERYALATKECNSDAILEQLQILVANQCEDKVVSNVICASNTEVVDLENGGTANIVAGQELLLSMVMDCDDNTQRFSIAVLIGSSLEPIASPLATGVCPTTPEVIDLGCIVDDNGVQWSVFQTTLNGTSVVYYVDINGVAGLPTGNIDDLSKCETPPFDVEIHSNICFIAGIPLDTLSGEIRLFYESGVLSDSIAVDESGNHYPAFDRIRCPFDLFIQDGYIDECDTTRFVFAFSDDVSFNGNTISFTNINFAQSIYKDIIRAKEVQNAQERLGESVTAITITNGNYNIITFNPKDATLEGAILTISGATLISEITSFGSFEFVAYTGCNCIPVELVQYYDYIQDRYFLDRVLRTDILSNMGEKFELTINEFDISIRGPYPGACGNGQVPVLESIEICCNDDLATNNTEIADKSTTWANAAESTLMLDILNNPIEGISGEQVYTLLDNGGGGIDFTVPLPTNDAPTFITESLNGVNALVFDGVDDRLAADLGAVGAGSPFNLYFVFSTTDATTGNAAILSGLSTGSVGSNLGNNTWQISRDGLNNAFVFRADQPFASKDIENIPCPSCGGAEAAFGSWTDINDGLPHMVSVVFDGMQLSGYLDGTLRFTVTVNTPTIQLDGEYFRLFGNRAGNAFLEGKMGEMFISQPLTDKENSKTLSYLICKWQIDPSIAAGQLLSPLVLDNKIYEGNTPFTVRVFEDGTKDYFNINTGLSYSIPPLPGLGLCGTVTENSTVSDECECVGDNQTFYIDGTNTVTLTGDTFCFYSIMVDRGSINVSEAGVPSPYDWQQGMPTTPITKNNACHLLQNDVIIVGSSSNARARISIIR